MARTFKLITISGAPHAGKTTVADVIVQKRPNTILIELDKIRHVYRQSSRAPWYLLEDAICLMDLWFRRDQDVVLLGPFWKRGYEDLIARAKRDLNSWDISYDHFTLAPPIEVLLGERRCNFPEGDSSPLIRDFYARDIHRPDFGLIIDNSDQTPEETAAIIMGSIEQAE